MAMKEEPLEDDVETTEDPFESVWVKAETVVVTPDYDNGGTEAKKNVQTKKSYNLKSRKCTICDFTTVHGNSLKYHMLTHTEERPYSCEYCDFTSKYPPILKRHQNTLHGDLILTNVEPELLTCNKCSYTTTIKQNLKSHVRKHKKEKQFKCSQCSFETAYRHNFVKHSKTHQQDVYKCDKCTFDTKYYGHITRHMEKMHNEVMQESKHICEFCQTTSKEKWKLRRHKERSIMKQAMRCVFCKFETVYKCQMRKHKKLHDSDNTDCCFTDTTIVTEDDINKFIQTDTSETLYKCDKCTFETKFQGHMTRHLETIHNEIVESGFGCEVCRATFTEKYKLRQHLTKSAVKHAVKCTDCHFETLYKCELRRHKKVEHFEYKERLDNREVSYQKLSETVQTQSNIERQRTVDNIDGIQCDKCAYKTLYELEMTKHSVEVHNLCKLCNHFFADKWSLNAHIIKSKADDVIKCTYCDFGSFYRCELKSHISSHYTELCGTKQDAISNTGDIRNSSNFDVMRNTSNIDVTRSASNIGDLRNTPNIDVSRNTLNVSDMRNTSSIDVIRNTSNIDVTRSASNIGEMRNTSNIDVIRNTSDTNAFTNTSNVGKIRNLLDYYMHDSMPKTIPEPQKAPTPYYRQIPPNTTMHEEITETDNNQLGQSKFGTYLIDQNCVDWRSIQVIETSDSVNRYKCPLCDFPSKFKACVQRHFQRHHTDSRNRPYKCVNCNFSTKTKDAIALHNKRNPPGPLLYCQICNYTTTYKCAYNSHTKFHYAHKCKICKSIYKHKHELIRHVATKHLGKGIKCHLCDFIALRKDSMASHALTHTGVKPFPCTLCEYGSVRKTLLDAHMRKKHGVVEKVGVKMIDRSKIESLKVPSTEDQNKTMEPKVDEDNETNPTSTHNEDVDDVDGNDYVMDPDDDVMEQDNDVMGPDEEDPINEVYSPGFQVECSEPIDVLGEDVKPNINLIDLHTELQESSHAPTEFLQLPTMETDEDYKEDFEETFACDQCGYTTTVLKKLAAHIKRKHDTIKKYKCILCPFRTSSKKHLVKHKETHKKNTAYKCTLCSFKSKLKGLIMKHLKSVHNKKIKTKYVCAYCNTSMSGQVLLGMHLTRNRIKKAMVCNMCSFETIFMCQMKKHNFSHLREERDEKDEALSKPKAAMYTKVKITEKSLKMKPETDSNDSSDSDDENTFKCEICPFESMNEKTMLKHFVRAHNGCKRCSRPFTTKSELEEHIKNSKSKDFVKCLFCDYDSDYKCETYRHMCAHFIPLDGVTDEGDFSLEDKIESVMSSIENKLKIGTANDIKQDDMKENADRDTENIGLQLEKNKFGNFLVDPSHIDNRSVKVQKSDQTDTYQCPACEFATKYRTSMQRHIQRNHANKNHCPYKCIDCSFSTKSKDSIRKHNQRKISKKILRCTQCCFTATVKCALAVHQKTHFTHSCIVCAKAFSYKKGLIAHFAVKHLKIGLKCQYCDFYSSLKETIIEHESTHTGIKAYQCSVCDYSVNRKRLLEEHFRRHHWHGSKTNKTIKSKPFKAKVEVKIEDMNTGEVLSCDLCNYTDTSKDKLATHIKRKHSMMFMCEKCPYTTPYKGALKTHSLTHMKYSLFKCKKCPYETTFKGRILSHLEKVHNLKMEDKDAKLICEFCNEKQRSYYMLKMHEESERYDKPAKCQSCDFVAIYKCQMDKHEYTHSGYKIETTPEEKFYTEEVITENVLKCRFCNFVGSRRGTVTRHEATHSGEKPHKCNMCGFAAKNIVLIMQHWKKIHGCGNKN